MYGRSITVLVAAVVACWAFSSGFGEEQTKENTEPILEYARDADTVVIMVDQAGFRDEVPRLRIYGDGRVLFHHQADEDYEMYLSTQEIDVWLRYLYDLGVLTFDRDAVKQTIFEIGMVRAAEAEARGQTEFSGPSGLSDAYPTIIEVRLKVFKPSGAEAQRVDDYTHRLNWMQPRYSAKDFPEVPELSNLAEATKALFDLTKHPDLVRINEK